MVFGGCRGRGHTLILFLRSVCTKPKIPDPRRSDSAAELVSFTIRTLRNSPNIFTSPSDASRNATVSTPSSLTGTSEKD